MKFGIVHIDGHILCDPIEYDRERFAGILNRRGMPTHNLPHNEPTEVIKCGDLRILPSADVISEPPDVLAYSGKLQPWTVVDNVIQRGIDWLPVDQETYIENLKAAGESEIDKLIRDEIVNNRGYDTVDSIAKYLRSESPFYAECVALAQWIDACWIKCHELIAVGEPLTIAGLVSQMPSPPAAG